MDKSDWLINVCHDEIRPSILSEITKHSVIYRLMTEVIAVCFLSRITESKIAAQTSLVFPSYIRLGQELIKEKIINPLS